MAMIDLNAQARVSPPWLAGTTLIEATVGVTLEAATARGALWQAAPGQFQLEVPGLARIRVTDGERITVDLVPGADRRLVERYLGLAPLAALACQRGQVPFHAGAAADGRGAILLAGDSGCGKSTLLAILHQQGWSVLADELAVVAPGRPGPPVVLAVTRTLALWPEALASTGLAADPDGRVDLGQRRPCTLPGPLPEAPVPLRAILCLTRGGGESLQVRSVPPGLERFQALANLVYNTHIVDALRDPPKHLSLLSEIVQAVPFIHLSRPRKPGCPRELAAAVLEALA